MTDEFVIRDVEPDDIDRIGEITVNAWEAAYEKYRENLGEELFNARFEGDWRAYKSSQVKEQCRENPEQVRVAVVYGEVAGFVIFQIDEDAKIGTIGNTAVDPPSSNNEGIPAFTPGGNRVRSV